MVKDCIKCGAELTQNNWARSCRSNCVNKCNDCIRKEKREYQREWRKKNPGLDKSRSDKYRERLKSLYPIKKRAISAYGDCRKRACKHGMDFNLTPDFVQEIFQNTLTCPYFGWELTFTGKQKTLASLDRIDSSRGYTKDNVRVISYLANLMKSYATEEELVMFATGVLSMRSYEKVQGAADSAQ